MTRWFLDNLGLKLVSLFLAIILWFYGVGEEHIEVTRKVPLKIDPPGPEMTVLSLTPWEVEVTLVGPRNLASALSSKEMGAYYKLTDAKEAGEYQVRIKSQHIDLPVASTRVQRIHPDVVRVVLDTVVTERIQVTPDIIGEPAIGYAVHRDGVQIEPREVSIKGPSTMLKQMSTVLTEPIDVVGRSRAFRKKARLALEPVLSPVDHEWIDIFVPFKEELKTEHFKKVPLRILTDPKAAYHWRIEPQKVDLSLSGPREVLETFHKDHLLAYVDASDFQEGKYTVPVQLELPPHVSPAAELPQVELTVESV